MLSLRKSLFLLLLLCILVYNRGFSEHEIDSLKQVLHQTRSDTVKLKVANHLSEAYVHTNFDSAEFYGRLARNMANHLKQRKSPSLTQFGQYQLPYSLHHISHALSHQGHLDSALTYCHRALALHQAQNNLSGVAQTANRLGLIYDKTGEPHKTLKYYFKGLEVERKKGDNKGVAISLGNIGMFYQNQGNYPKALGYLLKALKKNKALERKKGIAVNYANLANVYESQHNYSQALTYNHKALKLLKQLNHQHGVITVLGNLGNVYKRKGNYSQAHKYYTKALHKHQSLGNKEGMARHLGNIGKLFHGLYRYPDSTQQQFFNYWLPAYSNEYNQQLSATPSTNIGELLLDSAIVYQKQSYQIRQKIGEISGLSFNLRNIGDILRTQGHLQAALPYYQRSYNLADSAQSLKDKELSAKGLYKTYKELGHHDSALFWHEHFLAHSDSMFNDKRQKKLGRLETRYKWQQKQLKDSLQHVKEMRTQQLRHQHNMQQQRTYTFAGIGGFLLMLASALILYRNYRQKQKANHQLTQKNTIIQQQKEQVKEKNNELLASITYAKYLQGAIFPSHQQLDRLFAEHFVLLRPQEKVSGDFYWVQEAAGQIYFAVADCTGHGVPGAMVSVVGNEALNRCLREYELYHPHKILDKLTELIEEHFTAGEREMKDGMDIALCRWNPKDKTLTFAGANNPIYIMTTPSPPLKNKETTRFWPRDKSSQWGLLEIKGSSQPVGKYFAHQPFVQHKISLQKSDQIYLFSDGYPDQFGGPRGKKFMYSRFRQLLLDIQTKSMERQKEILNQTIENWKAENDEEQIDDICVMGIKVT